MLDRCRAVVESGISHRGFTETSEDHTSGRPCLPIANASYIDGAAKKFRVSQDRLQCHKTAVAETPDTDAVRVDIRKRLQIVGTSINVLRLTAAQVPGYTCGPVAAVTRAASVVGCENDV